MLRFNGQSNQYEIQIVATVLQRTASRLRQAFAVRIKSLCLPPTRGNFGNFLKDRSINAMPNLSQAMEVMLIGTSANSMTYMKAGH